MDQFLTATSAKLKSNNFAKATVVLGNESCDLDSAVSAIVYASFLYYEQIKNATCTRTHRDETTYTDDIFVPILNVDREDFALKTEVCYCLKRFGIDDSKLVFRNDVDLRTQKNNLSVILVDHHILANSDAYLKEYVTEIIDHRPYDSSAGYPARVRRTIEPVGSCATLVAGRVRELAAALSGEDYLRAWPGAAEMLHSTIILDTVNFSKQVQKGTPADEEMVRLLETYIDIEDVKEYRAGELSRLEAARADVSQLSAAQLLRKDVKVVGEILVPSFPILVEDFLSRPGAWRALDAGLSSARARAAVLLGMRLGAEEVVRDAAVYGKEGVDVTELKNMLVNCKTPRFDLTERAADNNRCSYYSQGNKAASRKQYIPVINEFLKIKSK